MREFYSSGQRKAPLSSLTSGQLVAVRAEEEEEILRAQVCEVMDDKVKVRRELKRGSTGHFDSFIFDIQRHKSKRPS